MLDSALSGDVAPHGRRGRARRSCQSGRRASVPRKIPFNRLLMRTRRQLRPCRAKAPGRFGDDAQFVTVNGAWTKTHADHLELMMRLHGPSGTFRADPFKVPLQSTCDTAVTLEP